MAERIDLQLTFKGIHHRGNSLIFENDGRGEVYLSKREIALRDTKDNRPVYNIAPGDTVTVNVPVWLALKTGLLREELA